MRRELDVFSEGIIKLTEPSSVDADKASICEVLCWFSFLTTVEINNVQKKRVQKCS